MFLGIVDSAKEIRGVNPNEVDKILKDFTTSINNANKIYPPLYLTPEICDIDGKKIIYIRIPEGTQVRRLNSRIWDRTYEGDIDITDNADDRDVVITNLIDSYARLMEFGKKHLNDIFVLDGIQSVSARDKILREIVSNTLAHRDYSNAYIAKLVIEKDRMFTENSNLPHGMGSFSLINSNHFKRIRRFLRCSVRLVWLMNLAQV